MPKKFWLFFLLFLHASLVLLVINQSLWLDEAITAVVVRDYSWSSLLTKILPTDFHPSIYYSLIKFWTAFFGLSELSLRLPSLLLTLFSGYLLFRYWGIWATGFYLLNPLVIYYSGEARMYALASFLAALLLVSYKLNRVWLYGLAIILAINSFYGLVFFLAALAIYFFWQKNWPWLKYTLIFSLGGLLIAAPLLFQQLQHSRQVLGQVANWHQVLGTASLKNLLLIPLKFSIGRISFEPKWLYYGVSLVWTAFVWLNLKWRNKQITLLIIPIILAWGFSFVSPLLSYFRFLYLMPIMAILFLARKTAKVSKLLVVLGFLAWSLVYVLNPVFHRENWQSLSRSLPKQAKVYGILSSLEAISYYRPDVMRVDLRKLNPQDKQILVIPYTSEIYGFNYQSRLTQAGYQLKEETAFHQLILETWIKLR